ncbi:MAG: nucleic acid-binding protein, contains PIN domain [Parcubacteria group bacterium Gr01-1014_66]|nr:MAG: nucleic acid-binding protein, contains PIN domain [Parcubacteria group bacterium Gr01-1014_66]
MEVREYCIDSDVLIDFLEGVAEAQTFLIREGARRKLWISVISLVELYAGIKKYTQRRGTQEEAQQIIEGLVSNLEIIALDAPLARRAGTLRSIYRKPIADTIIAAGVLEFNLALVTRNSRDFRQMSREEGFELIQPYQV